MRALNQITQPTQTSCVCTCVAMLLGKTAQEVIDKWHHAYYFQQEFLGDILQAEGVAYECHYAAHSPTLKPGGLYLLTVPSLNVDASFHQVIVDWRDEAKPVCFDPCKGRGDNLKYYTLDKDEWDDVNNAVLLVSWVLDFTITRLPE